MMTDSLNFKLGNPGAVQFGNFINYYQFHPPSNRIAMLPTDIWHSVMKPNEKCYILDVGCNAGDLTIEVYNFLRANISSSNCKVLGIDIDPTLIKRASEKNSIENITFKCLDIMTEPEANYLTNSNNKFDIIFCFSITMWIHLNHGDEGLKKFLKKVSNLTNMLVIEPQPWKCYKTAVKRFNKGFPQFENLKIRQNVEEEIEKYILNCCDMGKLGESDRTEWGRKLLFFQRQK
ncbi:unnamed protein product [Ceutorhynchus assimilis]|uniref:RNA methyltransferase n=1 Tax=Ceutorhynchus assimilis TaxID=467358 RepID=A0A9N9MSU6_9CUCU|nr:unnamed protein product [Ceutorhynchus assimilis]